MRYRIISPQNNSWVRSYKDMTGLERALDKLATTMKYPYVTVYDMQKEVKFEIQFIAGEWGEAINTRLLTSIAPIQLP